MASDPSRPGDASEDAGAPRPAASEAAEAAAAAKASSPNRTRNIVAGAAIGIGSAALVAALLYARSTRKTDRRDD